MTSATVRIVAAKIVDRAAEVGKAAAKIEMITAKITNSAPAIRIKVIFIRIVMALIDTIAAVIGYFPGRRILIIAHLLTAARWLNCLAAVPPYLRRSCASPVIGPEDLRLCRRSFAGIERAAAQPRIGLAILRKSRTFPQTRRQSRRGNLSWI